MATSTPIITALTHETFTEFVRSYRFVVIHFWAVWNVYDITMRRLIESGIPEDLHAQIRFATFDVDPPKHHDICREHNVMGPPFFAYYRDGRLVQTVIGLQNPDVMIRNLRALTHEAA